MQLINLRGIKLDYKKITLITGSARGIGKACAEIFHKEGAIVIITDIKDSKSKALARSLGKNAFYHHLDVGNEDDWEKIFEFVSFKFNKLDVLVNNAGIISLSKDILNDADHCDLDLWNEVFKVNSSGTMLGCKITIKLMKDGGGSTINISSRSAMVGVSMDVAHDALYLACDKSRYVTGIELVIDGGILAGGEGRPK